MPCEPSRRRRLLLGLCAAFPIGAAPAASGAPAFHAVARVTDTLSHGLVGDGLLSLNEAIQLHNGTLLWTQLSLGEQSEVQLIPGTGSALSIAWIDIDGSSVTTITVERDLDPILDTPFGLLIRGTNEPPVIDFSTPGLQHGLRAPANTLALQDLTFSGGPYGVDVTQTDVTGHAGATCLRVRFENHGTFGLRVTANTAAAIGRVYLEDCTFVACGSGIVASETGVGRTSIFEARGVRMTGVATGLDVVLGAGGTARYSLDRLDIEATGHGVRLQRPVGADRSLLVESTHVRLRATTGAVLPAVATGVTSVSLRMWDVRTAAGGSALQLGALGAAIHGDVEDSTFDGSIAVHAGGSTLPLALANLRCRNGNVSLGTSPAQALVVQESRFDACQLTSTGTGAIALHGCCVVGGSLVGSAAAPWLATDSHLPTAGAFVQQTNGLPAPQLGSMTIAPEVVPVGGTVTLQADLPPGLFGVFVLGFTDPAPALLPRPLHVYTQPALTVTVPGLWRLQQGHPWAIPNVPWYAGFDFTAQIAVLPDPGVQAPWLQLPPGRRFVLR
jgi:hypothetical protein